MTALTLFIFMTLITACPAPNGSGSGDEITYDANGFDQYGNHRDTGEPWNPTGYDRDGEYWQDSQGYDFEGYHVVTGLNIDGYDRDGFLNGWKDGVENNNITGKPWDPNGYERDGITYYRDGQGYDYRGYKGNPNGTEDGWNKDGKGFGPADENGDRSPYDLDGNKENGDKWYENIDGVNYDYQGWSDKGWHKDGRELNKNGYPYDAEGLLHDGITLWRDAEGYDYNGLDKNGFTKLEPVVAPIIVSGVALNATSQGTANVVMNTGKSNLTNNFTDVIALFNQHGGTNSVVAQSVTNAHNGMNFNSTLGGQIGERGFYAISRYLVTMRDQLPENKRNEFMLLMDAYRTRAYADWRSHGDQGAAANAELNGIYTQLLSMGVGANAANFDTYFEDTFIPYLSAELNLNPGLIRTLLNQMTGFERFYANVNDIDALGPQAVTSDHGGGLYSPWPDRTLEYIRGIIEEVEQALSQGQG